jgi:hypothetical protein
MAFADLHPRIEQVLGKPIPPEHSVHGLGSLPPDILQDAETLNMASGSLLAFAYLFHVTGAGFGDVKAFCSSRGWTTAIDEEPSQRLD